MSITHAEAGPRARTGSGTPDGAAGGAGMTHRQIVQALTGMLLALFTALLSSTIVSNALPTIITDLHGSESQYTWVVTATLLSSTASTPIWGKLSDLFSKKLLVQIAIVLYIGGSILAGFSHSVSILIVWRAVQGLGLGALQSLVMIVIAAMISPRERGRYTGPIAAVMSLATVAGPLIGGVIVDSALGWRWCFWVGAPVAVVALVVVQRTLNLPVVRRAVKIDYLGAALIAAGVCDLLIWVTLAGNDFAWTSGTSWSLVAIGVVLLGLAVFVESRAAEPIVPLRLFQDRTTTLAVVASVAVGVAMFGSAVFLGQYFQIARGYSPTASGLLTLPMIIGSTVSATLSGQLISRLGRWKGFLVGGAILMIAGFGLLATIDHATNMVLVGTFLAVLGLGMGMTMQNLVLAVQNTVRASDLGAASSTVTFFRSLGGTIGVSVLGSILASRVAALTADGLADAGVQVPAGGSGEVGIGSLNQLPAFVADIVRAAYGDGTATIFLVSAVLAVVSLLAIVFIKEVPLRTQSGLEQQREEVDGGARATVAAPAPEPATMPIPVVRGERPVPAAVSGAAPVGGWPHGRHARPQQAEEAQQTQQARQALRPSPRPRPRPAQDREGVGPAVYGFVTGAGGTGIRDAAVTLTGARGEQVARTTTAQDGGYEFPLSTGGTYLLVVSSGSLRPSASMVAVADRPARYDVTLAGGGRVSGTVGRGATERASGAAVTLIDARGDVSGAARTDETGDYLIEGVPAGIYTLTAALAGHQPVVTTVRLDDGEAATVDLQLPVRAELRGTVSAERTGRGVAEAVATLISPEGEVVGAATTGADGGFAFADLPAGTYTLTASGYAPDVRSVRVAPGATTEVRVELGPPAPWDGAAAKAQHFSSDVRRFDPVAGD
ncbi:MFS transporter [Pseudonocardia kujensis]|uniref:MFS transporter n=1 Tax=Pseudonocardia kujensis TaxID=1128675 RepID=UPI001E381C1F|nr:MFS transporter [Pseudonocardia kujensis]MCE0768464.1 MFS transporter [Pseudonocardia kujensis]